MFELLEKYLMGPMGKVATLDLSALSWLPVWHLSP